MQPELPIERFEIFANGLDHPECLAFDCAGGLWAGGEAGQVYQIDDEGKVETLLVLGGFCGGIAWTPDDSSLYVCNPAHGVVSVKRNAEWSTVYTDMICPNFGLFDSKGDYYVTDSGNWKKRNGRLLKNGEEIAGPFGYANGLALSKDEKFLYMVESDTDSVLRIELATGAVTTFATEVGRLPDGLAFDGEGNLYATCYASDELWKIRPDGAKSLYAWDRWAILLSRPTNLVFRDGYVWVSNLGRTTITRAKV